MIQIKILNHSPSANTSLNEDIIIYKIIHWILSRIKQFSFLSILAGGGLPVLWTSHRCNCSRSMIKLRHDTHEQTIKLDTNTTKNYIQKVPGDKVCIHLKSAKTRESLWMELCHQLEHHPVQDMLMWSSRGSFWGLCERHTLTVLWNTLWNKEDSNICP